LLQTFKLREHQDLSRIFRSMEKHGSKRDPGSIHLAMYMGRRQNDRPKKNDASCTYTNASKKFSCLALNTKLKDGQKYQTCQVIVSDNPAVDKGRAQKNHNSFSSLVASSPASSLLCAESPFMSRRKFKSAGVKNNFALPDAKFRVSVFLLFNCSWVL